MKYGPLHSTIFAIIAVSLNSVICIYLVKVVSANELGERTAAARTSQINSKKKTPWL